MNVDTLRRIIYATIMLVAYLLFAVVFLALGVAFAVALAVAAGGTMTDAPGSVVVIVELVGTTVASARFNHALDQAREQAENRTDHKGAEA